MSFDKAGQAFIDPL